MFVNVFINKQDFFYCVDATSYICIVILQPTLLFISGGEIAFILFIAIMVFGADKLPEIARGLGKGMRVLKDATNDIKHEITKTAEKNGIDTSLTSDITKELNEAKENLDDFTGSVKRKL